MIPRARSAAHRVVIALCGVALLGLVAPSALPAAATSPTTYYVSDTIAAGRTASAVAVNTTTNTIYVSDRPYRSVSVINATTGEVTSTISAPSYGIAVNEATNTIYLASSESSTSGSVVVVDGATEQVTATIALPSAATVVAVNAVTNTVYVANPNQGTVTVIDGATNRITSVIPVGLYPVGLAVNQTTNTVYTANAVGRSVSVIDGSTGTVASVELGGLPRNGLVVDAGANMVYVLSAKNSVYAIDGVTNALTTVPVEVSPTGIGVDQIAHTLFLTSTADNSVSVFDVATGQVTAVLPVGESPLQVAVDSVRSTAYVTTGTTGSVLVVSPKVPSPPRLRGAALPVGVVGRAYSGTVTASGLPAPTVAVSSGSLPAGLSLDAITGELSGTPAITGSASFTITATNPSGSDSRAFTIGVDARLTSAPIPSISGTVVVGQTLTAEPGEWAPAPVTLTYQWWSDGQMVVDGTSPTYTLGPMDVSSVITVTVTGSKPGFAPESKTSAGTLPVPRLITRVAGADRFATSAAISAAAFAPGVPVVYVASGLNFPDALSAAPVAARDGAPILLVLPDSIPDAIQGELTRLKPKDIVILGGSNSVSLAVERALRTFASGTVARTAGDDRFATSAAISAAAFAPGVPLVYIASGVNYPDALSAAPLAGRGRAPILLVRPDAIPASIQAELTRLKPRGVVVLGGTASVSGAVMLAMQRFTPGAVSRTSGADRFATSAAISAAAFRPGVPVIYIASGASFPDALSAAPVAGRDGGPILLVPPGGITGDVFAEVERLKPTRIVILGGVSAVWEGAESSLTPSINP